MPTESSPQRGQTAPAKMNHEVTPVRAAVTAPARRASDSTATRRRGWGSAGVTSAFTGAVMAGSYAPGRPVQRMLERVVEEGANLDVDSGGT